MAISARAVGQGAAIMKLGKHLTWKPDDVVNWPSAASVLGKHRLIALMPALRKAKKLDLEAPASVSNCFGTPVDSTKIWKREKHRQRERERYSERIRERERERLVKF